jgi:hypothetical protein
MIAASRLRRGSIGGLCTTLAVLGATGIARAQQPEEGIRIVYVAPSTCPSEGAFFAQVRARTRRVVRAPAGARARTFAVTIVSHGRQSTGHLVLRDPDGTAAERDVVGDTCEEVVEAFALITALSVDPSALTSPVTTPTSTSTSTPTPTSTPTSTSTSTPTPTSTSTSTSTPTPTPTSTPPAPAPAPAPTPTPAPTPAPAPAPRHSASPGDDSWTLALSASAAVNAGITPPLLPGVPVFLDVALPRTGLLAWTFRAGFERTPTTTTTTNGATADFTWTVGLLEACPTRWTFGTLTLSPCLRAEAGILEGAGHDILPARDQKPPWLALGATARAQWFFLGPVFLDLDAGLRFPLLRTRYLFEPDTTIAQSPAVGWMASAGLGVRFL